MPDLAETLAAVSATGYSSASDWCLNCNVGWLPSSTYAPDDCWLCGRNDNVWRWRYGQEGGPVFDRKRPKGEEA